MPESKSRIHHFLTNPKNVKISAFIGVIAMTSALIIGVIIAQFDPQGYNFFENYISDMGSTRHTPFPYLWDLGQMICACSMIPAAFYLKNLFNFYPENIGDIKTIPKRRRILSLLSFISMLTVLASMFMVGLFSEDRTTIFRLHLVGSYTVWSGYAFTGIFFGLTILFYPTPVPKPLGAYMIVFPPIPCVIFLTTFNKFSEWFLMFSLIAWIVPIALIMLKHINSEIKSNKDLNKER